MSSEIRSYVIRTSKMSKGQKRAYQELYSQYCLNFTEQSSLFKQVSKDKPLIFEIGFGMGDATIEIAKHYPENFYIGIEVHKPGIGRLLNCIHEDQIPNLRVIEYDAVEVCKKMLSPGSVEGFHIFFPDPWPKKRHHKRRLIQVPFVETLVTCLKQNGYIYAVTDWEDYALHMLHCFNGAEALESSDSGFFTGTDWRPTTKFEKKGLEKNHRIFELHYRKR